MIISISSGKGGTGKTTVAVSLALSLEKLQFIDCDVEEPNAHIFLNINLKKTEDVYISVPKIDKTKCDFCKKCSELCQYNAIAVIPSSDVFFFPELCHGCGGCKLVCSRDAITEEKRVIGVIESGNIYGVEFYHGILNVGETMATPIVKILKKKIDTSKNVILDTPPGVGCPVIETIRGSDFCVLVTEPTPFGLYDLKLAVNVVRGLKIPFGVIINRSSIGDDRIIDKFCQTENITIMMKIPYSKDIAKLYSQGIPFVTQISDWYDKFKDLFDTIKEYI